MNVDILKEDIDEEPEERLYKIAEWAFDDLRNRFEKFAKRADKLGVTAPYIEIVRTEDEPEREYVDAVGNVATFSHDPSAGWRETGKVRRFHYVRVVGEAPHFEGWSLLGVVERDLEYPDGPHLVHVLGDDVTVEPAWRSLGDVCDHCSDRGLPGKRGRKQLVIVKHEDGRIKIVGKSCLVDFLGSNAPKNLTQSVEWLSNLDSLLEATERDSEDDGEWRTRGEARFVADIYLAWVAISIRTDGWVPRSLDRASATADVALQNQSWRPSKQDKIPPPNPEPQDIEVASKALAWAIALDPKGNDFLTNLSIVAHKEAWRYNEIGIGAAIISAYYKDQEFEIKRKERAAGREAEKTSQYVGTVGTRQEFSGTIVFHTDIPGDYGVTRLFKIHDADGNVIVWFASNGGPTIQAPQRAGNDPWHRALETGDKVAGKATVKDHNERDGVKQTVITRAKFELEEQA